MSFSAFWAYIVSTLHQTFKRFRRICEMQQRRWPLLPVKCFDNNAIVVRHYVDFIFLLSQIKQVSTHNYTRALPITYGCFSFSRLICMLKQSAVYIHTLLIPLKQTLWAEDRNFWFAVKMQTNQLTPTKNYFCLLRPWDFVFFCFALQTNVVQTRKKKNFEEFTPRSFVSQNLFYIISFDLHKTVSINDGRLPASSLTISSYN